MTREEVRKYREISGLSQAKFAQALNVSLGSVQSWESGVRNISPNTAILIKQLYGDSSKTQTTNIVSEQDIQYSSSHRREVSFKKSDVDIVRIFSLVDGLEGNEENKYELKSLITELHGKLSNLEGKIELLLSKVPKL